MGRGETTTTYFSRPHGARLGAHSPLALARYKYDRIRTSHWTAPASHLGGAVWRMFTACVETHLRGYDLCYVIAQAPQPVSPYPRTCAPRNRIRRAPYAHARPRSSHTRRVRKAAPPCWCRPVWCTLHHRSHTAGLSPLSGPASRSTQPLPIARSRPAFHA